MTLRPLEGFSIGITADRRWEEQAQLLERRGATTVHAPTISTLHLAQEDDLRRATLALVDAPPQYLVATTGIGMRTWFDAARTWELGEALGRALGGSRILARGHKAAGSLQSLGLDVWQRAPNERLAELVDMLLAEPLAGARVAFQEHGSEAVEQTARLQAAGATVVQVPVYRWRMPADEGPALRLVDACCSGRVDAVTFTSAPAVANLFVIAEEHGRAGELRQAFNRGVLAGCVGPVCGEAAREAGIEAPVLPEVGRLGLLVRVLSDSLQRRRRSFEVDGAVLTVQGSRLLVDGAPAQLTPREQALFEMLTGKPGAVFSRPALLGSVWGSEDTDPHLLEVTVARLRRRLGPAGAAVRSIPGRGYRFVAQPRPEPDAGAERAEAVVD